jgi:hypothetical protein
MISTGKCPSCTKIMHIIKIETIDVQEGFSKKWKGAVFQCPHCSTVLSAGMDPLALVDLTVSQVLKKLKGG